MDWLVREGGVERKDNSGKVYFLFLTSYLSLQRLLQSNCYTMSTLKPLHAYWDINTHILMSQRPELIRAASEKRGYYLIIDTCLLVYYTLRGCPISLLVSLKCSINFILIISLRM